MCINWSSFSIDSAFHNLVYGVKLHVSSGLNSNSFPITKIVKEKNLTKNPEDGADVQPYCSELKVHSTLWPEKYLTSHLDRSMRSGQYQLSDFYEGI